LTRESSLRRRRRHTRGAALVEAVVVLPVFVALLAALFYVTELYLHKLGAFHEARQSAWSHALGGCHAPTRSARTQLRGHAMASLGARGVTLPSESGGLAAAAGGADVAGAINASTATASRRLREDRLLGLLPTAVSADTELPCNERPRSGNLAGALEYGWEAARFW
jgi:Flp pilus assembly protein TadG